MFYAYFRIGLIFLFVILGVILHRELGLEAAWYLYAGALLLTVTHYIFGNVWMAFYQLKKGNLEQAEQLLKTTRRPQWLVRQHRSYYHFTHGMIALQRKAMDAGRFHLGQSLELGLKNETDEALVCLNLAHIAFLDKDQENCQKYLDRAKSLKTNDLLIKKHLKELEDLLAA